MKEANRVSSSRAPSGTSLTLLAVAVLSLFALPVSVQGFTNILTIDPNPGAGILGSTTTVSVVVRDFESMIGFDLYLRYDSTPGILDAIEIDFEESIMLTEESYSILVNCVDGQGLRCRDTDGPGLVRAAALIVGGSTRFSDGILFNIRFKVVGIGETALDIFEDQLANPDLISHETFDGVFSGEPGTPEPDFVMQVSPGLELVLGLEESKTTPVSVTGTGGFSGTISLEESIFPSVRNGPLSSLSDQSITLGVNENKTSFLTVWISSETPADYYVIVLNGTSGVNSHYVTVSLAVLPRLREPVSADVTIEPAVVRSTSRRYLTAYVELPSPYFSLAFDPATIELSSVLLNYEAGIISRLSGRVWDHDRDGLPELVVRFELAAVAGLLTGRGVHTIIVTGVFTFEGGRYGFLGLGRLELT